MHPGRILILLLTVIIAARTALYVGKLYRTRNEFDGLDDMAESVARNRLRAVAWLLAAEGAAVVWGLNLVFVDAPLTWRTVVSALATLTMQLLIACGIAESARGDRDFALRFAQRALFYCTNLTCEVRARLLTGRKEP